MHAGGQQIAGRSKLYFVVELLDAPPGLLEDEAAPPLGELLEAEPPLGLEDIEPDVPPVPLGDVLELEDAPPGLLGAVVVDDDDDDPPGTTIVSFSFVTVLVDDDGGEAEPPGITVVVSFFSQALSASAAAMTIKYPLRFMSTPFSFCGCKVHPRVSKCCAVKEFYPAYPLRQRHQGYFPRGPSRCRAGCADRARP